ncbi:MAG: hypothetical protein Q7S83_03240 [bacterium]|nr:hypothetical protein [bacterium]
MDLFKKQLWIQLGISLGLTILAVGVVQFLAWHVGKNSTNITELRNELALRTRATESLATLKNDADKAAPLTKKLDVVLPSKDKLINFGREMTDLAQKNGAELSFDFGGETSSTADTPGFIKFSLTGLATYANWSKFLKDVEKGQLYIKFNSVDMTRQSGGDNFNIIAEGQVFFQ